VLGTTAALGSLVVLGGFISWWRDSAIVGWSWKDTGAFGEHTYAGGADKAGHAFAFYTLTRLTAGMYRWLGLSAAWSLALGASFAFLMSNVIEVVDGFTRFGFEYEDAIANSLSDNRRRLWHSGSPRRPVLSLGAR
jgi:hypothetical protein